MCRSVRRRPEWAREINVEHFERTLAALPQFTRLVYLSSDHVFGGDGVYDEHRRPVPSALTAEPG
jgi:dTDP-4-dehydrorhamnose reductase